MGLLLGNALGETWNHLALCPLHGVPFFFFFFFLIYIVLYASWNVLTFANCINCTDFVKCINSSSKFDSNYWYSSRYIYTIKFGCTSSIAVEKWLPKVNKKYPTTACSDFLQTFFLSGFSFTDNNDSHLTYSKCSIPCL